MSTTDGSTILAARRSLEGLDTQRPITEARISHRRGASAPGIWDDPFATKGCQSPVRGPMQTECIAGQLEFEGFDGRRVVAAFDGGVVTSDAGAVLLREADRAIGLIERVAACFTDHRDADQVIHALPTLIGQRIVAIALGYEDVNDHDTLRRDLSHRSLNDASGVGCTPILLQ